MESQPQDPEFRKNPESFHPCEMPFGAIRWADSACLNMLTWLVCVLPSMALL